jgi:CheY-like chemotaxis protein
MPSADQSRFANGLKIMNKPSALLITDISEAKTETVPVYVLHTPLPSADGVVAKHILLADDDPGIREMLGRVLQSEGYLVTTAQTGLQAFNRFAKAPPDLVLLDLNMPEQDGWEAFGRMCIKHPMVPVIIITARSHQEAQANEFGVDALMEKPLDLPLLLQAIQKLLAETEAERTRRLVNPDFTTAFLKNSSHMPPNPLLHHESEKPIRQTGTHTAPDHPAC